MSYCPKMTWFCCWHRNWLGSCVGGGNRRAFSVGNRSWLDFGVGSDLTWFYVGVGNDLVWSLDRNALDVGVWGHAKSIIFRVGIEMDSTSALGSKLTWFCVGGRNWLRFSASTEIDLFWCGGQNWPCFRVRTENYLFLVWALKLTWFLWWSKLTWSQYGGPDLTSFQCRDENHLVVWVVEFDLFLVCWPKTTCFYDEHENWHGFCVDGPIWHEFSVGDRTGHHFDVGVKLVWLLCGWSKLTRFCTRGENRLFLAWAVECCGLSKLAWFQCGGPNLSRF